MKVNVALCLLFAALAQSALGAPASKQIDCMLVKNDALFGAERARAGDSLEKGLQHLTASIKMTDEKLVQTKRKPMSLAMKTQSAMSFTDGDKEALRQPDQTVDQIAGEAYLACTFAKYK